jgi:hypothetical protein
LSPQRSQAVPFRALRRATVALATFDSVAALGACAAKAGDGDATAAAPHNENAEPQPVEKPGSEDGSRRDAASDAEK